MSLFSFFSGSATTDSDCALPEIYSLGLVSADFCLADIVATYTKILTDTFERTHGIPKKVVPLLWDNVVQNSNGEGLVTMLVTAMVKKTDLFLVYAKAVDVLRLATPTEQNQIRADYAKAGKSAIGVYISFRNYRRTDMLQIYAALEYCILCSLYKTVNISKAVQIKMSELRSTTSLADSGVAIAQAKSLATALREGSDILLDANDDITTASPNIDPTEKAISFLDAKRAYYLDLPISYISGMQTGGIGSTGEADMRAVERGLKQYFFSIVHPVLLAIFGIDTEFKSHDFRQMDGALEALKTFELIGDENISGKSKREVIARMLDLDPAAEEKELEREAAERGTVGTLLNGAQVAAMTGFLEQLASGNLAEDTAVQALMVSFNLDEELARGIVEPMKNFKRKNPPTPAPAPGGFGR